MKILILMGSPRLHGNTAELCKPFIQELESHQAEVKYMALETTNILPCKACYICQDVPNEYGCVLQDDMHSIVENVIWADCIIFATPIFSWYCTSKMKVVLDRHYGLNKYYGNCSGSLWEGKKVGIIATHGYEGAYATEPFETGIKRLCKHSKLQYIGMYSVRDTDNLASFQTEEAVEGARAFARFVLRQNTNPLELVRAAVEDAELIWRMQIEAFADLLAKYQDMDTNPGNEPIEKVVKRLEQSSTYFYLIKWNGEMVGAIRVIDKKDCDSNKRISPLFILPRYRNLGIAQEAITAVENIHGKNNWELDTILQEAGNCYLYEKMGYQSTGKTEVINDKLTLTFYEKKSE